MEIIKKLIVAILTLFSVITIHAQTTYFVSLSGNDSNDGLSQATAWRTISYAASASSPVAAGDTVYIKAGDYGLEDIFIDKNYSPNDAAISFIGYQNVPGDINDFNFTYGDNVDASVMPLINPNDRTTGEGINLSDIYSITIKNIQIANSLGGISIWNTTAISSNHLLENIFLKNIGWEYSTALGIKEGNGNVVRNCLIVNATGAGMDIWGDNNQIINCKVYSNESQQISDGTYTSMDYYIVLKGNNNNVTDCYAERDGDLEDVGHGFEIKESGENNLFENCTVKNMIGGCFSVRWSAVKNNEFKNCTAIGGVSDDVSAFMIREGASYNTFNACTSRNCQAGIRFLLAGEDADYCGTNNTFNNCIIKNAQWAIDLNPYYYNSAPADSNSIVNCVIYGAEYLFNCERPNSENKFVNTIINNVTNLTTGSYNPDFTYHYCDFFNNGFEMPNGQGNMGANPMFVDEAGGDFHLQTGSPCVDNGTSMNAPAVDFDGISRPQGDGFDIGAFEFSSSNAINENAARDFYIYPNPAKDVVYITGGDDKLRCRIFLISGKLMKSEIVETNKIDLSGLKQGIYLLEIDGFVSKKVNVFKLIKE